jgi:signal transduction histidine kinase
MSLKEPRRAIWSEGQLPADWAICLVRWGLIACVLIVALLDPADRIPNSELALFLAVFGAYNLAVTLLLYLRFLLRFLPIFTVVVDSAAAIALIYLSGGTDSPFFFVPILPILIAALRWSWQAGLAVAAALAVHHIFQVIVTWEAGQSPSSIFQPGLQVLLYFLAAAAGWAVGQQKAVGRPRSLRTDTAASSILPDHFRMIYEMASSLSATLNYERVLEAILDISRLGFDELGMRVGEAVGLVLLYEQEGSLLPAAYRNLVTGEDETRSIKGVGGIVGEAISTAQAVLGESPAADPELHVFQSLQACRSMICVPLRAGFETYGAVLFASIKEGIYTSEHLELLTIFCNQATIALQNAGLYQSLREERDKIMDKEEEARHKLARDLHDGPTQDVAAIAMRLNFARLLVERDPGRAKAELERLEDLAHRTVKEIRSMLFTLRPIVLETEGLVAALNQYAENLRENDGIPVEVDAELYRDCLDIEAQGVVFAILEEAVNNAKKHAQATRIWVRLAFRDDLFVAQVADNGRGFDVEAVESSYGSRGSLGMVNLKERAALVGGNLNIESAPGQGTRITLLVPIAEELV